MKRLPIGIDTFENLRTGNHVYIDKTKIAYELIETGKYYFLSRPRRFGKSLFVDTLHCIFEGKKELFEGLFIYDNYDWEQKNPVIKISFGAGTLHSRKELDRRIIDILKENQKRLDLECEDTSYVAGCFNEVIRLAYEKTGQPVVVLVDEYDKPILDNITDIDAANEIRDGLRNFYSVIKDNDRYLRFAFLTGVSKFSQVSLFSGLNNLKDITLDERYGTICGYTQRDVETSFVEHLDGVDLEKLKEWYNGYSWLGESVYNPFDILLFFDKGKAYKNYWFETATPNFLINLLKERNYFLPSLETLEMSENDLGSFEVESLKVETLLFQTGYLTIREEKQIFEDYVYSLTYPNKEVRKSLNEYLFRFFTKVESKLNMPFYRTVIADDFDAQRVFLTSLFASIPYNNFVNNRMYEKEGYYASVMYAYFASLGLTLIAEDVTNKGRIDLTLKIPATEESSEKIYIFEFKVIEDMNNSKKPLDQIKERGYADKYSGLKSSSGINVSIFLIGIEFSKKERNICGFEWEK
ncbi:MAG: ATP-binding protein, partial [Spirochaetota bacterium]|nr:ATP-binding protein [Spirochaetota bacterium]